MLLKHRINEDEDWCSQPKDEEIKMQFVISNLGGDGIYNVNIRYDVGKYTVA